jgi:iron complex outermembrane receptor protein
MRHVGLIQPHRMARAIALACAGSATLAGVAASGAAGAADEIQSVIVTSQSRRQAAQDVPIAMQVLGANDIANLGARDLAGLDGYLPGLEVDGSQATQPVFGIRGVKAGDFGIGTDSPVGIYVDGVYTGKTGGALMNFIDVQRIELLKGPQGTLFGRNSAAGAIAVVTNQPDQDFDTLAHVKLGQYHRVSMDAMVNLPLAPGTAARLVLVRDSSDGWAVNRAGGERVAGDNSWAARLSVAHKIGAAALTLGLEHEQLRQHAWPAFGVLKDGRQPLADFRGAYDAAYTSHFVDPRAAPLENDTRGLERRLFDGATVRAELPLGQLKLSSITAYRTYKSSNLTDNDGSARRDYAIATDNQQRAYNWQQEFKLSGASERLDWVGGASFYDNRERQLSSALGNTATLDTLSLLQGGGAPFAQLFGGLGQAGVPGLDDGSSFPWREDSRSVLHTRSASLFADVIWHGGPATNFTAGLRWSHDRKTMRWHIPSRSSPELDAVLNGTAALTGVDAGAVPANLVFVAGPFAATPVSESKSWSNWSPRFVVDHKLDKDTLLFASLSQGYQAGGFNIFTPPNPASASAAERDPSFAPEKMTNLELGFKMSLPRARATLNGSLFAYAFKNLQDIKLTGGGAVPTYNIVNSDQKARGLDLDGRVKLGQGTTVFGSAELIDQTYTRYRTVDSGGGVVLDLSGQTVGTPLWSGMAGVTQSWDVAGGHANATLQGNYRGRTRCNDDTRALQCLRAAAFSTGGGGTRSDLRLGWDSPSRRYGVALIVNNLFDRRYVYNLDGQGKTSGVPYASISPPRIIALELKGSL